MFVTIGMNTVIQKILTNIVFLKKACLEITAEVGISEIMKNHAFYKK